jgi:hypothetical protein
MQVTRSAQHFLAWLRFLRDPIAYHRYCGVKIGRDLDLTSPQGTMHMFGSEPYLITIGNGVTIGAGTEFITHDGGLRVVRDEYPGAFRYRRITVGDRAFIGARSLILPGVTIGEAAVIGAGSVVTKSVPPRTVAAGVPARVIKSVADYWPATKPWIDTSGLNAKEKQALLLERLPGH